MAKQLISLFLSVFTAASLLVACQPAALDEIIDPNPQEPEVVPEWTTIPYSLKVGTEGTRVSYDESGNTYSFQPGDKIRVKGTDDRTDISGELEKNGDLWTGKLTYLSDKGAPKSGETGLEVTLIHNGNPNSTEYGTALVGGVPSGDDRTLLQYAVENYSLFTATYTYNSDPASLPVTLLQQATFLDVNVEFDFDGSHIIDAGKALVDLTVNQKDIQMETDFHVLPDTNGEDFYVHFIAVVPGEKPVSSFKLTVGDREITFSDTSLHLYRNWKYTVNRKIAFHPQVGDPFWSDGTYGRLRHPSSQEKIVGIVVFVHDYKENMTADDIRIADAITEKASGFGHGLVMALTNAEVNVPWSAAAGKIQCTDPSVAVTEPEHTLDSKKLSGYTNTESIRTALTEVGAYSGSAAELAKTYTYNGVLVSTSSTTGWFLPSVGQWMYTISEDGFGEADHASQWVNGNGVSWLQNGYSNDGDLGDLVLVKICSDPQLNVLVKALNDRLEQFKNEFDVTYDPFGDPSTTNNVSDNYWTSSEKDANNAIRMNLGSVRRRGNTYYSTIKVKGEEKTKVTVYTENSINYNMKVRPFLAF